MSTEQHEWRFIPCGVHIEKPRRAPWPYQLACTVDGCGLLTDSHHRYFANKLPCPFQKAETMNQYPILQYFVYDHLPARLQLISKTFHDQAHLMARLETDDPDEMTAGLRHLLQAKDCAVRAAL